MMTNFAFKKFSLGGKHSWGRKFWKTSPIQWVSMPLINYDKSFLETTVANMENSGSTFDSTLPNIILSKTVR